MKITGITYCNLRMNSAVWHTHQHQMVQKYNGKHSSIISLRSKATAYEVTTTPWCGTKQTFIIFQDFWQATNAFSWYRDNKNKRSSSQKLLIIVWGKTLIFHLFMMSDLLNALCRSSCFSFDSSCRCSAKDYSPKKTFKPNKPTTNAFI